MPRLNHKKSRKGCRRCRERKVKCDERQPVCGACAKHNVPCHFDQKFVFVGASTTGKARRRDDALATPPNPVSEKAEAKSESVLELRLMHHYSVAAYSALLSSDATDVWQCYVPELAFQHPYLLNAVLSFSALHLYRFGDPADRSHHWSTHQVFFERALQQHRVAISSFVDQENKDAHVLAVALITWQTFLLLDHDKQPYEFPMTWLRFTCHTQGVLYSGRWWNSDHGRLSPFFRTVSVCFNRGLQHDRYKSVFLDSDPIWSRSEESDPLDQYDAWIRCMGAVYFAIKQQDTCRAICRFTLSIPTQVGPVLLDMLRDRRPRAIALLGHMFCIIEKFEGDILWHLNIPETHIKGIEQMLTPEWREAIHKIPQPE